MDIFTIDRNNPILSSVYPKEFVAVNRTLPGHFLHPGKVTRRVFERNGQVIVETSGVGSTPHTKINDYIGNLFFKRIDNNLWFDFTIIARSPELQKQVKDQPCNSQTVLKSPPTKPKTRK